jgi:outer membrane protein OmpA-like peptidoglycan-associated protein
VTDLNDAARISYSQEDHWIPLSDLMTGLMMIFMLVAIVFMVQVKRDEAKLLDTQSKIKNIALLYTDLRAQLHNDLALEFKGDFKKWHAALFPDLTVRFEEPSIQFDTGMAVIKDSFKDILQSFFPRYVGILVSPKYHDAIQEVRIEGHTSTIWKGLDQENAYYQNMALSQERTRAVLIYVLSLPSVRTTDLLRWLIDRVTANGLSSAGWLKLPDGSEDTIRSQRVEFKVRTNAEDQLAKMVAALKQ